MFIMEASKPNVNKNERTTDFLARIKKESHSVNYQQQLIVDNLILKRDQQERGYVTMGAKT